MVDGLNTGSAEELQAGTAMTQECPEAAGNVDNMGDGFNTVSPAEVQPDIAMTQTFSNPTEELGNKFNQKINEGGPVRLKPGLCVIFNQPDSDDTFAGTVSRVKPRWKNVHNIWVIELELLTTAEAALGKKKGPSGTG
jgi:hypothetical protein